MPLEVDPQAELGRFYLKQLERALVVYYVHKEEMSGWMLHALNRSIWSMFLDCHEVGFSDRARKVFREAHEVLVDDDQLVAEWEGQAS